MSLRPRGAILACVIMVIALTAAHYSPGFASAHTDSAAGYAPTLRLVGPGGGEAGIVALIDAAKRRVLVEAFALNDGTILGALERARRRGVDARVMLDAGGPNSQATLSVLGANGVRARVPNPAYAVTHLDFVVADTTAVAVSSATLQADTLGYAGRAYVVVDRDRFDVLQAASLFYDDWLRRPVRLFGHNLLILPDDAARITGLIDGAGSRIELYTSGIADGGVLAALRSARSRGVVVRVLTPQKSNSPALRLVAPFGSIRFRDDGAGTVLVVDRRDVLVGSMDLSGATLTGNRELGVIVRDGAVASAVDTTFFSQFARGILLTPPVPVRPVRPGHVTVAGSLAIKVEVSRLVRVGGQGEVIVATAPGARIGVTIVYPSGSKPGPGTTGGSGVADKHGSYIYRWILAGSVKPGQALLRVTARGGGKMSTVSASFPVAR